MTLKKYIFLFAVLAVLIPTSGIAYLSYTNGQYSLRSLLSLKANDEFKDINNSLSLFLSGAQKTNMLINSLIMQNSVSMKEKEQLGKYLMLDLKMNKDVMSIEYADESKEYVGAARDIFGNDYAIGVSGVATNQTYNLHAIDENNNIKNIVWKLDNYDSRVMPWYQAARKADKPTWTSIYLWPNGEYGIDFVSPTHTKNVLSGVVDVSIKLNYIKSFVEKKKTYSNSQLFIVEPNGLVVAGTDVEEPVMKADGTGKRIEAKNSKNAILKAAYSYLTSHYSKAPDIYEKELHEMNVAGKKYYLNVSQYKNDFGIDWVLMKVDREEDIMGTLLANARNEIIIITALLFGATIIALFFARYVTDPLVHLVEQSKLLADGNLASYTLTGRTDEIGILEKSFFSMAHKINTYIKSLKEKEKVAVRKQIELQVSESKIIQLKDRDESILSSIGDGVFATDSKGVILLFNKVAEQMTGIPEKKAIGCHYDDVVHFVKEIDGSPANDFVYEAIASDKITKMANHVQLVRKDGGKIPVADSAAPVKNVDGTIMGCVVVFHDVTKERQIDKAKTEFVSLVSHQLRTPLSSINWYAEMLLSEEVGKLTQEQKKYTQEVYNSSQRMSKLVSAILNVTRLELGTFSVEPEQIEIVELAKGVLKEYEQQIRKKQITLKETYDKTITSVNVDPKLLAIVFQNLLSNSIKYTGKGGTVDFKIEKKDDNMQISVSDNGMGIPETQKKEIFTKLFRADNAKKMEPDGNGLGLYIVKEIITHAGGEVWFETAEGKGTCFYASLPLSGMLKKIGTKRL